MIKTEFKSEEKPVMTASLDVENLKPEPIGSLYVCANCTAEITLTSTSALRCPNCEHLTGSSTVFYKVRTQATTYDTI